MPGPIIKAFIQNATSLLLIPLEVFGHPAILMEVNDTVLFFMATSAEEVRQLSVGIPHQFPNIAESVMSSVTTPLCGAGSSFPDLRRGLIANFEDCSTMERAREVLGIRGVRMGEMELIPREALIEQSCLVNDVEQDIHSEMLGDILQFPLIEGYFEQKMQHGNKMQLIGQLSPIKKVLKF